MLEQCPATSKGKTDKTIWEPKTGSETSFSDIFSSLHDTFSLILGL